MSLKLRLLPVGLLAALALPATAGALKCAPPGVSAISQYVESVPGSSCDHPTVGTGSRGSGGSLPPGTSAALSRAGAAGRAVARLVTASGTSSGARGAAGSGARGATGSSHPRPGGSSRAGLGTRPSGLALNGSGRNPVSGLLHPILSGSRSGGTGVLLPIFLIAAALLLLLAAVVRRRLGSSGRQM